MVPMRFDESMTVTLVGPLTPAMRCVLCAFRVQTQGISELAAPWAMITDPPSLNGFSYRRAFPGSTCSSSRYIAHNLGKAGRGLSRGEAYFLGYGGALAFSSKVL